MTYRQNDVVRFRCAPGNDFLTIIECDGHIATCRHGDDVIHVAVGDIYKDPCDCAAATEGKWANIHSKTCAIFRSPVESYLRASKGC